MKPPSLTLAACLPVTICAIHFVFFPTSFPYTPLSATLTTTDRSPPPHPPNRRYMIRDRIRGPTRTQAFVFPHGAMFCLGPETNEQFYHSIVKEVDEDGLPLAAPASAPAPQRLDFPTTARVSLTFRSVATFRDASGAVYGRGEEYQELDWPESLNGAHRTDDRLDEELPKEQQEQEHDAGAPQ
jgi:hypothetical protein